MYRLFRMRRYNPKSIDDKYDFLFPQAITTNILRNENGGVLESDLLRYDRHLEDGTIHFNRALSSGSARALSIRLKGKALVDGLPVLITLHTGLEAGPTLSFNGGEPYPILNSKDEVIPGGQVEGSRILVVFDEAKQCWQLISDNTNSEMTRIVLPVLTEYLYTAEADHEKIFVIPGFDKRSCQLTVNYQQTILRKDIDYIYLAKVNDTIKLIDFELSEGEELLFTITSYITTAKHGHYRYELQDTEYPVVAREDNTTVFDLPSSAKTAHAIVVNYGQTILRNNRDYVLNDKHDQITLQGFALERGEELVFRITEFVEAPGEFVPNNWGTTGTYRYRLKVIHGSYTATENNVTNFAVPQFNYKRDEIAIVGIHKVAGEDVNQLYILDVDYTIDEIGHIQFLNPVLMQGDEVFYTIIQGAMVDVPNFNVIRAIGPSAQHLLLDISENQLCDFYTVLVQLSKDLLTNPTIKCIDGPARPLVDCYGHPIIGGYKAGAYMWIVYNEKQERWYSLSHSQVDLSYRVPTNIVSHGISNFIGQYNSQHGEYVEAQIPHNLGKVPANIAIDPCEPPVDIDGHPCAIGDIWSYADEHNLYVGNTGDAVSKFRWTLTSEDNTNDLRSYMDEIVLHEIHERPGTIVTEVSTFTASRDGVRTTTPISNYDPLLDKLIVNYNQTVLRRNIDYSINMDTAKLTLTNFTLNKDDILQFIVFKQSSE